MVSYHIQLEQQFLRHADPARAVGASAYMLNQFEFYGIPMPERRKICHAFIKTNPLASINGVEKVVKEAWKLPEREWQYFAIELLMHYKKQWRISTIEVIEYCIIHKSWWDTVDWIADALAGEYFILFPEQTLSITGKWNRSDNMWLQRSSLLFQKKYKNATDTELLRKYILHLSGSKEFFICKAIGWILREYAKTDPVWVKNFVQSNELSSLSKREALKHF